MRLKIDEVTLTGIKKKDAFELCNEIIECGAYDGFIFSDKYPRIKELFKLLNGSFDSSQEGVHFIRNKGE